MLGEPMTLLRPTSCAACRRRGALAAALLAIATAGFGTSCGSAANDSRVPTSPQGDVRAGPRIALQVGHWRRDELPDELAVMRNQPGATTLEGIAEPTVGMAIARAAKRRLEEGGIAVDVVPATVPPGYRAQAFVSIHADGSPDATVSGFKVAASGGQARARLLSAVIARNYATTTGLPWHPTITGSMTGYYAFNARRYVHAVDPATPGVVLETGFLTSPADRSVIVDAPDVAGAGVARGVLEFLRVERR
jgi:hypothetical protein